MPISRQRLSDCALTTTISATGASSYPQSTASGSQYARCRAIDGRGFDDGEWVAMAMTSDPATDMVTVDVRRAGASILTAPVTFQAKYFVELPIKVNMQPGDEIIASLDFRKDGDWHRVGKEIHYRLREGAPFTFGRALGLGDEPIDHGTQLSLAGFAVFNRVLSPEELKSLAFNELTQRE